MPEEFLKYTCINTESSKKKITEPMISITYAQEIFPQLAWGPSLIP